MKWKCFIECIAFNKDTGCWEWIESINDQGYGYFYLTKDHSMILAHRYSWMIFNGTNFIPSKLCVCHKCDNRKCINPTHLFLGTRKDNNMDCANKGRRSREDYRNSLKRKLSYKDIMELKHTLANDPDVSYADLSRKYGITRQSIYYVKIGKLFDKY